MTTAEPDIQPTPAVNLSELRFGYEAGHDVISIEQFRIEASERLFLCGPSGSGKSTLLALVGGVIAAKRGELSVLGEDLVNAKSATRDRVRADHIGFIFQQFNLVPYLSVEQNVQLPCRYSPRRWQRAVDGDGSLNDASTRLLSALGIDRSMHARRATALSVGQQQRVAVARALIGSPELIIADEPTSALDSDRRREFIDLLLAECERTSSAVVFVSHDGALADHFDRAVDLQSINRPETVADA